MEHQKIIVFFPTMWAMFAVIKVAFSKRYSLFQIFGMGMAEYLSMTAGVIVFISAVNHFDSILISLFALFAVKNLMFYGIMISFTRRLSQGAKIKDVVDLSEPDSFDRGGFLANAETDDGTQFLFCPENHVSVGSHIKIYFQESVITGNRWNFSDNHRMV